MAPNNKRLFLAKDNGFKFINAFDALELSYLDSPIIKKLVKNKAIIYGLCGGMCFAALDFHLNKAPIPTINKIPETGTELFNYLQKRQKDSMSLSTLLNLVEWMVKDDLEVGIMTAEEEFPKLKKSIDQGIPAVLALVRVGMGNPTLNHQVLAVDYEINERTKDVVIDLYDPNHPGKEPKLVLNFSDPEYGINPEQTTGEPLRGFFVIDYERKTPPESLFHW